MMLVSIITPCYNSSKYIADAINSVKKQTYSNWELIIIDDFSTDDSVKTVQRLCISEPRIKLIMLKKNAGVANARNEGIKQAEGKFIAFLDSDDLWDINKLEKQIQFMIENNYSFTHTCYRKIDSQTHVLVQKIKVSEKVDYKKLLKHNEIGCLTAIYDVSKIGKVYFPDVGHEDFAAWLQILRSGYCSYGLNMILASYRVHSNTVSSNKFKAAQYTWHILRNVEMLSLAKSSSAFLMYIFKSLYKYLKR